MNVSGTVVANTVPLPTELAGVSVLVGGKLAPILAVASQQINFQVPFEAKSNLTEVRYQGLSTFAIPQTVAPGIFLLSDGTPAIQHASDYSLVTSLNPAVKGEVINIYATGLGAVSPAAATGMSPTGAAAVSSPCQAPFVNIGTTIYAGVTPVYTGLYQMNVRVRDNLPSGTTDVYIYWPQCWLPPPPNYAQSNIVKVPVL